MPIVLDDATATQIIKNVMNNSNARTAAAICRVMRQKGKPLSENRCKRLLAAIDLAAIRGQLQQVPPPPRNKVEATYQIHEFSKSNLQLMRKSIDAALAPVAAKFSIHLKAGNCRFTQQNATFSLEASVIHNGKVETKQRVAYRSHAASFGLPENALDAEFKTRTGNYKIAGLNPLAPKYSVLATRLSDGKQFKFAVKDVLNSLDMRSLVRAARENQ